MKVEICDFICQAISQSDTFYKVAHVFHKLCVNVRGSWIFCWCELLRSNRGEMSWFHQVNQGSHPQQPAEIQRPVSSSNTCNPPNGLGTVGAQSGAGSSTPSPFYNFPSAPHAGTSPLRLQNLSCASPSADPPRDPPEPISYVTLQEQRCVLSWFQGWNSSQRERFLQDLLGKAVPGKVCTLLDSLSTLQVQDKLPNIFECQLRLWTQWFESWGEEDRNHFLHMLEECDPTFVALFYRSVAGTAGRD